MANQGQMIVAVSDDFVREPLAEYFTSAGYDVTEASSAEEALVAAGRHSPVVVLLDIGLPDMSGLDVGERIRLDHPETEVVLLTDNEDLGPAFGAIDSLDLARLGRAVAGRLRTVPAEALTSAPR
jgi:DNA-binding response OmpR family regulator